MASVLWEEIKSVEDPAIRRGLLKRIAGRFVERYRGDVAGDTLGERMTSLAGVMGERQIPFAVDRNGRPCRCFRRWLVPTRNWPRRIAACARWKS